MPTDASGGATPILVGIVARAHGIHGEVVVEPTTDTAGRFAAGRVFSAGFPSGRSRTLKIETSRPFQGRWLVRFEGIETRNGAETLHGAELSIRRDQVAPLPEGSYYRFDLVGLEARTSSGAVLGRVTDVFSTGANDVLTVRGEGTEILVPLLDTVLRTVDLESGVIVLDPPPGLPGLPEPGLAEPPKSPDQS